MRNRPPRINSELPAELNEPGGRSAVAGAVIPVVLDVSSPTAAGAPPSAGGSFLVPMP